MGKCHWSLKMMTMKWDCTVVTVVIIVLNKKLLLIGRLILLGWYFYKKSVKELLKIKYWQTFHLKKSAAGFLAEKICCNTLEYKL